MSVVQRLDKEDLVIDVLDRSYRGGKKEALRINAKSGKVTIADLDAKVDAGDVADGSITAAKIAANAVTTAKINALAVTDAKLAADSVITAKILNANVTEPKLATDSVSTAKIVNGAVTKAKAAVSVSAEQTGTGASQNVAHGLTGTPSAVLIVPTAGHDGLGAAGDKMPTIVEGAHGATNVVVTVDAGAKFKVFAWV
jgi:hypothetical protein